MKPWLRIFLKEARELFRDRRVVVGAFVMPVLMIFLMSSLFSKLGEAVKKGQTRFEIGIVAATDGASDLIDSLETSDKVKVHTFSSEEAAIASLKDGDVRVVLVPPVVGSVDTAVRALYDSQSPLSEIAMATLKGATAQQAQDELKRLAAEKGIDPQQAESVKLKEEDVRKSTQRPSPWMGLLPYLIVLWAFYGGFGIASDLVAGEKEKGTLETLLVTPATRRDVVIGKWLALATCCFLSSMTSVLGLVLSSMTGKSGSAFGSGGITLAGAGGLILILIPLVLVFASILLMVSAYARSIRESQTYLTLVSFLVLMPAIMSQFVGITGEDKMPWVHWTPVLNSAVAMSGAIKGSFDTALAGKAILVDVVLAVIFLALAWRHFHREQILNRT